jgi:hypothetical protein
VKVKVSFNSDYEGLQWLQRSQLSEKPESYPENIKSTISKIK